MRFVRFTEYNDHEGETWRFWLQQDGNEEELNKLQNYLLELDDNEESFDLTTGSVEESEVDTLVKHSRHGYMAYENKVTGKFTCPEMKEYSDMFDEFYKGDIARHFK